MMVHLATVRTTLGVTNSSPLLSLRVQVPHATSWQQYGLIVKSKSGSAEAVPYGLFYSGTFSIGTPRLSLFACVKCLLYLFFKEVFKWLIYVFKRFGWESFGINTQDFKEIFLIGDERGLKANIESCLTILLIIYDRLE